MLQDVPGITRSWVDWGTETKDGAGWVILTLPVGGIVLRREAAGAGAITESAVPLGSNCDLSICANSGPMDDHSPCKTSSTRCCSMLGVWVMCFVSVLLAWSRWSPAHESQASQNVGWSCTVTDSTSLALAMPMSPISWLGACALACFRGDTRHHFVVRPVGFSVHS